MTRKPLWASGLADEPESGYDDVVVRVLEEEPPDEPPPPAEPPGESGALVPAAVAAVVTLLLLVVLGGRGGFTIEDVPSGWEDIPMTCKTIRLDQGDGAAEFFRCRAEGGRPLPPGDYSSPDSRWTSDLTRQPARENRIRISPEGEVVGWAKY